MVPVHVKIHSISSDMLKSLAIHTHTTTTELLSHPDTSTRTFRAAASYISNLTEKNNWIKLGGVAHRDAVFLLSNTGVWNIPKFDSIGAIDSTGDSVESLRESDTHTGDATQDKSISKPLFNVEECWTAVLNLWFGLCEFCHNCVTVDGCLYWSIVWYSWRTSKSLVLELSQEIEKAVIEASQL
eukprot:GHVR01165152.1.p1 GENE.GHVR01165152.1~~GHVR01165152.1.p1  ORF type:complete len:184 (+),score=46.81 GHVR01165152.1:537-1088(+)